MQKVRVCLPVQAIIVFEYNKTLLWYLCRIRKEHCNNSISLRILYSPIEEHEFWRLKLFSYSPGLYHCIRSWQLQSIAIGTLISDHQKSIIEHQYFLLTNWWLCIDQSVVVDFPDQKPTIDINDRLWILGGKEERMPHRQLDLLEFMEGHHDWIIGPTVLPSHASFIHLKKWN